ncbi:MAG: SsrA-binding protein SmpB [Candidatus Pacebacteria bacterium]|nr:SsrA-binding protein SmpB [Candidatus Paceibacterota bacterium]
MSVLIKNKKATLNYEILETFHAGIELFGHEVKSLRASRGKLDGAHVLVRGGEAYVVGMSIQPYQPGNTPKDYEAERPRRLLLTKKELYILIGVESTKGLTLIPLSCYNRGRLIKIEIASVRGKKQYDKREDIKKRDTERDMRRTLKGGRA